MCQVPPAPHPHRHRHGEAAPTTPDTFQTDAATTAPDTPLTTPPYPTTPHPTTPHYTTPHPTTLHPTTPQPATEATAPATETVATTNAFADEVCRNPNAPSVLASCSCMVLFVVALSTFCREPSVEKANRVEGAISRYSFYAYTPYIK